MSTTPDATPDASLVTAATEAAAAAVTITRLTPGPVTTDDTDRPAGLPLVVALMVTGALEGTVTLAADDELVERIEYAGKVSGAAEALAPVAAAVVKALGAAGPVEASPLAEVEADAWPGDAPVISTAVLTGSSDPDEEGDDTLLAVAFALTVPPPVEDEEAVSGAGRTAMSTSGTGAAMYIPSGNRVTGVPLSAEARRLGGVEVDVAAVLGETTVQLHDLLSWLPGVIVSLHRDVGMPVDVRIDDATVAHAEIVVVDERYALRVIDVVAKVQARVAHERTQPGATGPPS